MAQELTTNDFPPELAVLSPRRRNFVIALCAQVGRPNFSAAYRDAGYCADSANSVAVQAHRLAHDARVQAAIMAWARATASTEGLLIATNALMDEAANPQSPQRVKAAEAILNRIGFHAKTEQVLTVERVEKPDDLTAQRLARVAKKLGLTLDELVGGRVGKVIDVTPELVEEIVPIEDFLRDPNDD